MNILTLIKGHYIAGKEACSEHNLQHRTTIFNAMHSALIDILYYKVITYKGAYIVYEVVNKPNIGLKASQVCSIYVPKYMRSKGIASKLFDMIPVKPVILVKETDDDTKYKSVGTAYVVR